MSGGRLTGFRPGGFKDVMTMKTLELDLETFSDVDLLSAGVYPYAESSQFDLLLFGYSVDGGEVQVVDVVNGECIPDHILKALTDDSVLKYAHNASFERICLSVYLRRHYPEYFRSYSIPEDSVGGYLDPAAWRCTMVWAAYDGLPLSLRNVGAALHLDSQKMDEGKALIRFFCVQDKNGVRHYPAEAPDKWEVFKQYNKRDVEVEMAIQQKLSRFPVPEAVWDEYHLSEEINDRGILIDMPLVKQAVRIDALTKTALMAELQSLTGLENPNSVQQMKGWLSEHGINTESLGKKDVQELMKTAPPELKRVLSLRQQLAKSSVKKYTAMQTVACYDHRARGTFQFYGASRSGRFAGRYIQLQNLPQNHIEDLAETRELLKSGDYDAMQLLYDNIPDTLSQLIRTAFVPRPGYKFIVADFSAIEARVIAWLAGEQWRMNAFANGEDIYCASASKMFGVPVVKHGVNGHLRQKGKIAELACGYGGSVGAMKAMGGDDLNLTDAELKQIVDDWRTASPHITELWWAVDDAVKTAIRKKTTTETHGLRFIYQSKILFIELPSKRRLAYVHPAIGENRFGGESVTYMGTSTNKKWERIESYGPKFVENIVQAVARDLLMFSMQTLRCCFIVATVHDEMIIECSPDVSLDVICKQMARTPAWAEGLLLRADGYECEFYKKD